MSASQGLRTDADNLATGAVHSSGAPGLRTTPRSMCARRNASHTLFRRLIGVGATTVNAYLAQEASPTATPAGFRQGLSAIA
jgi:hypothetical protein